MDVVSDMSSVFQRGGHCNEVCCCDYPQSQWVYHSTSTFQECQQSMNTGQWIRARLTKQPGTYCPPLICRLWPDYTIVNIIVQDLKIEYALNL